MLAVRSKSLFHILLHPLTCGHRLIVVRASVLGIVDKKEPFSFKSSSSITQLHHRKPPHQASQTPTNSHTVFHLSSSSTSPPMRRVLCRTYRRRRRLSNSTDNLRYSPLPPQRHINHNYDSKAPSKMPPPPSRGILTMHSSSMR